MKKPNLFKRFLYLFNIILAFALLASYVAWFINPSQWPLAGIIAMMTPVLLGVQFCFLIFWLFFYKRFIWISLISILLGWWHIPGLIQFRTQTDPTEEAAFTTLSYNVKNYYPNHPRGFYVDVEKMIELVEEYAPDIFCVQEFQSARNWVPQQKLKYKFLSRNHSGQLAIFSAFPFIQKGEVKYSSSNRGYGKFIWADVKIGTDTVRIINLHLASIGLENKDLHTFANIDEADEASVKKSGENIISQLRYAFKLRGNQVDDVTLFLAKCPHPVVLCGDFNDPPVSYAYREISKYVNDAFTQAGAGFGGTHVGFVNKGIPLRIDYIFSSQPFEAVHQQVIKQAYSDHFAVVAQFVKARN